MDNKQEKRAPRLRAYLDKSKGVLFMRREEWDKLFQHPDTLVEIAISDTPMASINDDVKIIASFAERKLDGGSEIIIFRDDPKDAPKSVNVDRYNVWEYVTSHIDVEKTVMSCSTSDDAALRSFFDDYVAIVPAEKGLDHHLTEIPAIYKAMLKGKNDAS